MTGMGMRRFQGGAGGGNPFQGGGFGGQDMGDIFGDIFGEMFNMGGNRRASRVQRGRDLRYDMSLEFTEAVFGVEKEINDPAGGDVRGLQGHRRGQGKAAADLSAVQGRGAGAVSAGLLCGGADVCAV